MLRCFPLYSYEDAKSEHSSKYECRRHIVSDWGEKRSVRSDGRGIYSIAGTGTGTSDPL